MCIALSLLLLLHLCYTVRMHTLSLSLSLFRCPGFLVLLLLALLFTHSLVLFYVFFPYSCVVVNERSMCDDSMTATDDEFTRFLFSWCFVYKNPFEIPIYCILSIRYTHACAQQPTNCTLCTMYTKTTPYSNVFFFFQFC